MKRVKIVASGIEGESTLRQLAAAELDARSVATQLQQLIAAIEENDNLADLGRRAIFDVSNYVRNAREAMDKITSKY